MMHCLLLEIVGGTNCQGEGHNDLQGSIEL